MAYQVVVRGISVNCENAEDAAKLVRLLDDGAERVRLYAEGGIGALEQIKKRLQDEVAVLLRAAANGEE